MPIFATVTRNFTTMSGIIIEHSPGPLSICSMNKWLATYHRDLLPPGGYCAVANENSNSLCILQGTWEVMKQKMKQNKKASQSNYLENATLSLYRGITMQIGKIKTEKFYNKKKLFSKLHHFLPHLSPVNIWETNIIQIITLYK